MLFNIAILKGAKMGEAADLQISDFLRLVPLRAQWLPKCTSEKVSGKCWEIHRRVGCWMICWREVTTTRSHVSFSRCKLLYAPASFDSLGKLEFYPQARHDSLLRRQRSERTEGRQAAGFSSTGSVPDKFPKTGPDFPDR